MGMMPHTDWKQWAASRPEWIHEDIEEAFEGFVEHKLKYALNVAAAEPTGWEAPGARVERSMNEIQVGSSKKAGNVGSTAGAAAVEAAAGSKIRRRCCFFTLSRMR
jgi:hypothetical protein